MFNNLIKHCLYLFIMRDEYYIKIIHSKYVINFKN